jgi:hypothetical protein
MATDVELRASNIFNHLCFPSESSAITAMQSSSISANRRARTLGSESASLGGSRVIDALIACMHSIKPDGLTFSVNAVESVSCLEGGLGMYRFPGLDDSNVSLLDLWPGDSLAFAAERSRPNPFLSLRLFRGAKPAFKLLHSKSKSQAI